MKAFIKKLSVPVVVAVISCILSVSGTLGTQQYILLQSKPNLKKDVVKPDLSGLSPEVKKQITLIPINYSLQNISRSAAQNITIFVRSDTVLNIPDLKFSQESEDYQVSMPDPHELKITAPSIRPNGLLSVQILTPADNSITFSELSDNATIVTSKNAQPSQNGKNALLVWLVVGFGILIWLPILCILIYLFVQIGKYWRTMESDAIQPEIRNRIIILLIAFYIYDDIVIGSTGMFQAWLPLPRINFAELTSIFVFYLIVTRYKLLEEWLKVSIQRQRKTANLDESGQK